MPPPTHFTPISFPHRIPPPLCILPYSQESLPCGRGHFNVGRLAEAIRGPDSSTPHTRTHINLHLSTDAHSAQSLIWLNDMACMFSISLRDLTLSHHQALDKGGRGELSFQALKLCRSALILLVCFIHQSIVFNYYYLQRHFRMLVSPSGSYVMFFISVYLTN